jgi:ring-1,2-phenylacetyl-CoA epoxidase subunit PaaA
MSVSAETREASERYLDTVRVLLRTQGWREILAADLFADALKYVPTPEGKRSIVEHIREELEHFEMCERVYASLGGDLWRDVQARIAGNPWPRIESWPELAMFEFLNDRAGKFQLREYRNCSFAPYAAIINRILADEEGHVGFGEAVVKEMCAGETGRRQAQALFDKWLPYCLRVFGRPDTPGNRYAVRAGLKARDSGLVMRDYIEDLKPAMAAYGLRFPPPDRLGAEIDARVMV